MKKMVVDAKLFLLASTFVSPQKDYRSNIQGVYIHPHKNFTTRLVATDGRRLIVFEDSTVSPDSFPMIIRPEKALLSAIKSSKYTPTMHIMGDGWYRCRECARHTGKDTR